MQKDDLIKSSFSVSEVVGEFDAASLQKQLEKECKAETIVVNGDGRWWRLAFSWTTLYMEYRLTLISPSIRI